MRIIPAIDIIEGKCVRLTKGDYTTKKIYNENPLEVAKSFEDAGIEHLHLVDLDGAKSKHIVNYKVLESIAGKTQLNVDFGGGLKRDEDLKIAFESGANQITAGSIAVNDRAQVLKWLNKFGPDKIILGSDCKNRMISTSGWLEDSDLDVLAFLKTYQKEGMKYTICTDISKDGMLQGPSTDLYKEVISETDYNLIASGGISGMNDIEEMAQIGCEGVIIGKAIYEGKISLKELEQFNLMKG